MQREGSNRGRRVGCLSDHNVIANVYACQFLLVLKGGWHFHLVMQEQVKGQTGLKAQLSYEKTQ